MINISSLSDDQTARTCQECAMQRAENLAILGSKNAIELCCGPSLKTLENAYKKYNISLTGNDIELRWKRYYPEGNWIIGDAFKIDFSYFDTIVFAPPVSLGCTGKRQDMLTIPNVVPGYKEFLKVIRGTPEGKIYCIVLPARSFATQKDRKESFNLLSNINNPYDIIPLKSSRRQIIKYWDVYFRI